MILFKHLRGTWTNTTKNYSRLDVIGVVVFPNNHNIHHRSSAHNNHDSMEYFCMHGCDGDFFPTRKKDDGIQNGKELSSAPRRT